MYMYNTSNLILVSFRTFFTLMSLKVKLKVKMTISGHSMLNQHKNIFTLFDLDEVGVCVHLRDINS